MSIKAIFPAGHTEITVNGLHQWDYGQQLEIECANLPALVEVHFACEGMSEAVVRVCSVAAGVLTAAIPDRCLEQALPVYAWVVRIDETSGTTVLKVTMPIEARPRPAASASVPEEISDKYTESIAAINAQIGALADGTVIAAKAKFAEVAEVAECDNDGKRIKDTYAKKADLASGTVQVARATKADVLNAAPYSTHGATQPSFPIGTPGVYVCTAKLVGNGGGDGVTVTGVICVPNLDENCAGASASPDVLAIPLHYNSNEKRLYFATGTGYSITEGACYCLMTL